MTQPEANVSQIRFVFAEDGARSPGSQCVVSNGHETRVGTIVGPGTCEESFICEVYGDQLTVFEREQAWRPE